MSSPEPQLHGLVWVEGLWSLEPRWSVEPDIEAIKQTIQSVRPSSTLEVTLLAQGGFNKIYDVKIDNEMLIMRLALPVDPFHKTASEVATMDWIRRTTNLPVPSIISYQASRDNLLGFEWILMTKIPGEPLGEIWKSVSFSAKTRLVKEIAASSACLFRNQLRGIGNIYGTSSLVEDSASTEMSPPTTEPLDTEKSFPAKTPVSDEDSASTREKPEAPLFASPGTGCSARAVPDVGRIVSMHFFWGSHIHQDIYRGPFRSSKDWITARLTLSENAQRSNLAKYPAGVDLDSDGEDEVHDAKRTLQIIDKLKSLLPLVFPTNDNNPEPSMIFHDDLSRHNIIVSEGGKLTGVIDWECCSALPLWKACDYPSFLEGKERREKPDIGRYYHDANGEPDELYWEHLLEHERTIFRDLFIGDMKRVEPGWVEVFDKSEIQRDFDYAVLSCDSSFLSRPITKWIVDVTAGKDNIESLYDRDFGILKCTVSLRNLHTV
ncbi:hypothetical protein CNMCM5793_006094 [Aspergillus hiratsukae]|uniref:Aminoglycoside phosphotransferase domain-containing protein n=1 Tax=Aspergillus hiratsukae TaxID=1194566 RepID=A0A8H6ULL5_9EURO|nr:hypothetical protein CNMCM5793_006094 [Aspergillus hiratsukae]KAF7158877.1 hypothetical protein CNMCM6106_005835 [Aspergillus hiratsukae]